MLANEVHYLERGWENLFETRKIMGTSNRKKVFSVLRGYKKDNTLVAGLSLFCLRITM